MILIIDVKDAKGDKMSLKYGYPMFTHGPFASASLNADEFSENLYFAYLFEESIKRRTELDQAYENALKKNDTALLLRAQNEIDFHEGLFNLTLTYNFDGRES